MTALHRIWPVLAIVASLASSPTAAQPAFYLRAGDRVVFYGDSITEQRLYTTFVETFAVTRFPAMDVRFVHSGWSGDRVSGGGGGPIDVRLDRDVLAHRPTVVTVMLGMNDGGVQPFAEGSFNAFADGYRHIVRRVKQASPNTRITALLPSPFDDVTRPPLWEPGYNAVLERYGAFVKDLAQQEGVTVADLNGPVVRALRRAFAADPQGAAALIPDRVHPGPGGHLLMAGALLEAWHAPALVSLVRINVARRLPVVTAKTRVTNLRVTPRRITWTQLDRALPMPLNAANPTIALALRSSNFTERLNQQDLKLMNLPASRYTLKIDGQTIGTFTRRQLVDGINLAMMATPMAAQAAAVHALTLQHNEIHFNRWRWVQVPAEANPPADLAQQLEALDAQEEVVVRQQRQVAQPVARKYELVAL